MAAKGLLLESRLERFQLETLRVAEVVPRAACRSGDHSVNPLKLQPGPGGPGSGPPGPALEGFGTRPGEQKLLGRP